MALVLLCNMEWINSSGIAAIKPNAVVFIASEMLCDNSVAFSAGSALATAVNAAIKPMIVPSNPSKVAMLANVAKYGVRRSILGNTSSNPSSIAYSMSERRRVDVCRFMPSAMMRLIADLDLRVSSPSSRARRCFNSGRIRSKSLRFTRVWLDR